MNLATQPGRGFSARSLLQEQLYELLLITRVVWWALIRGKRGPTGLGAEMEGPFVFGLIALRAQQPLLPLTTPEAKRYDAAMPHSNIAQYANTPWRAFVAAQLTTRRNVKIY